MTLKNNASDSPHHIPTLITRRSLLQCGGLLSLGGCSNSLQLPDLGLDTLTTASIVPRLGLFGEAGEGATDYAAVQDEGYLLPAIPYQKVKARFRRQRVVDPTGEAPGTIVVVLQERHLYFVLPGGEAIRYGVGIGKDGFRWSGRARIQYKKKWPVWTPPEEMIQRRPDLVKYRSGMPPGLTNPLGARALYIFHDGVDTLFRIHGSPEWWTIGQAMSSGCIRMINQDIVDLYERVSAGATIVVG